MRKSKPTQPNVTLELTKRGVFQISTTPFGRKKIAKLIRLRAIGKRESDGATFAQRRKEKPSPGIKPWLSEDVVAALV